MPPSDEKIDWNLYHFYVYAASRITFRSFERRFDKFYYFFMLLEIKASDAIPLHRVFMMREESHLTRRSQDSMPPSSTSILKCCIEVDCLKAAVPSTVPCGRSLPTNEGISNNNAKLKCDRLILAEFN